LASGLLQNFFASTSYSSLFSFGDLVIELLMKKFLYTFIEGVSIDGHKFADVHFTTKAEFLGFNGRIVSSFFFG